MHYRPIRLFYLPGVYQCAWSAVVAFVVAVSGHKVLVVETCGWTETRQPNPGLHCVDAAVESDSAIDADDLRPPPTCCCPPGLPVVESGGWSVQTRVYAARRKRCRRPPHAPCTQRSRRQNAGQRQRRVQPAHCRLLLPVGLREKLFFIVVWFFFFFHVDNGFLRSSFYTGLQDIQGLLVVINRRYVEEIFRLIVVSGLVFVFL